MEANIQDKIRFSVVRLAGAQDPAAGFNVTCTKCKRLLAAATFPQRGVKGLPKRRHPTYCNGCAPKVVNH